MILSIRHAGQAAIVQLQGQLTLSPALLQLKPRIDAALFAESSKGLVLNLAAVSGIDSVGLGELVSIHTSATRRGVRVALVQVSPRIQEMLAITRLDGIFAIYADEASALQRIAQSKISDQA